MPQIEVIYVGQDAVTQLTQYCNQHQLRRFTLIADANTYHAMGEKVEMALKKQDFDVATLILTGKEVVADEHYLMHIFINAPVDDRTFLAVGSGTLTDITRFVSHRMKSPFIGVPTAPSVDGYASTHAPLVVGGVKESIGAQPPRAIFADIDTLNAAPPAMIAAGYGDLLAKITALADWKIGHILWDEPYDESIAQRLHRTYTDICSQYAGEVGRHTQEGVRQLMNGLIEAGLCMLEFGNSRCASGAEHHISHYWEMKLLQEGRPAILHGAKVSAATVMTAQLFEKFRNLNREELMERLEEVALPERTHEEQHIRDVYGPLADQVMRIQSAFLSLTPEKFDQIKHRIADHWDELQQIAAIVPSPHTVAGLLEQAGAPTNAEMLGLGAEEIELGYLNGHYLRYRFTSVKLARVLSLQ